MANDVATKHFINQVAKVRSNIETAFYESASDVLKDLIDRTPEDTGASKGNWQAVLKLSQVKQFSPSATNKSNAANQLFDIMDTHRRPPLKPLSIYFANPTPYSLIYEYGLYKRESEKVVGANGGFFSRQAVGGVVRQFEGEDNAKLGAGLKKRLKAK